MTGHLFGLALVAVVFLAAVAWVALLERVIAWALPSLANLREPRRN